MLALALSIIFNRSFKISAALFQRSHKPLLRFVVGVFEIQHQNVEEIASVEAYQRLQ